MSWYSDGEPFDEYEPDYCGYCTVPAKERSKAVCDRCKREHEGIEEEEEEEWN